MTGTAVDTVLRHPGEIRQRRGSAQRATGAGKCADVEMAGWQSLVPYAQCKRIGA